MKLKISSLHQKLVLSKIPAISTKSSSVPDGEVVDDVMDASEQKKLTNKKTEEERGLIIVAKMKCRVQMQDPKDLVAKKVILLGITPKFEIRES